MKKNVIKIILSIIFLTLVVWIFQTESNAAVTMSISPSSKEVAPNGNFKVTITVKGGAGYVNISASNGTISSKREWLDNSSVTLNCVATGPTDKAMTITASGVIGDYNTEEDVEKSASTSVKIKTPTQTTPTNNKTTNNKDTKTEKTKTPVVETKEKEEAASEFGIHALKLIGVKETKEEVELALDKAFNIKSYEYVCNISNDIKTVKIEKEAYEYNDLVQITGLEEELKVGENNISLKLAKDGKEIIYHIKIIKEEPKQEEVIETNTTVEDKKETIMVSIPLIWFIVLEVVIVILSVGTTIVVINYLKQNPQNIKNKKQTKGKDEEKEFKKI